MKKSLLKIVAAGCLLTGTQAVAHDIYGLDISLGDVVMTGGFNQQLTYKGDGTSYGFGDYELEGYGLIGNINDIVGPQNNQAPFDCGDVIPGSTTCNLVFNFGGFSFNSLAPQTNNGFATLDVGFDASNSYINFYLVDASYDVDPIGGPGYQQSIFDDISALSANQLYLDLSADSPMYSGTQYIPGQPGLSNASSTASGGFEVQTHNGAGWYYDLPDNSLKPDVQFVSSINGDNFSAETIQFDLDPNAKISRFAYGGVTFKTQVPEPSTLAMFSVALLGFGAAARRRRQV